MTWNGRQLRSMYRAEQNLTFTYDENGMRVGKSVISIVDGNKSRLDETTYTYAGSQLISEIRRNIHGTATAAMHYSYDTEGTLVSVNYNGTEYYYLRNGQNDVVGLVDGSGSTVVEYRYDAWGKLLSTTGALASTLGNDNPIRYRGYYYDTETGLYYLQSRYYDPDTGRLINSDDAAFLGATGTALSCNLFAYCENNPVNCSDPSGYFVIRRWMIACIVDALLCLIPGLSMTVAPIKTIAKQYAGVALKQKLKSPLTKLLQFVVNNATKLLNGLKSAIVSLGSIGKWLAGKINVSKMVAKLAGLTSSVTVNKILNCIVPNIDIFLSVGGIVSGILDLVFDKKLNNSIWTF